MADRRHYSESLRFEADTRRLEGTAIVYGDVARTPFGRERFAPGSFTNLEGIDAILNVMHRRDRPLSRSGEGLTFADSPTELRVSAILPQTREADDAVELIRTGVYKGFSIEFDELASEIDAGIRVVTSATLNGIAIADRPAYKQSTISTMRYDLWGRRQLWL